MTDIFGYMRWLRCQNACPESTWSLVLYPYTSGGWLTAAQHVAGKPTFHLSRGHTSGGSLTGDRTKHLSGVADGQRGRSGSRVFL